MAGMARRGPRGAHSARHRAGRSQPDVANADAQVTHGSRPPDEFGQVVDGGPGPIGTTAVGTASVGRFGPMGGSEVGPDRAAPAAPGPLRRFAPPRPGPGSAPQRSGPGHVPRPSRPADRPRKRILRSRSARIRIGSLVCAAVVVIIAGVTGVGQSDPSVAASVKDFLLAWESGNYSAAAALTTGRPDSVIQSLRSSYSQLGAQGLVLGMGPITVQGSTAKAYFNASIDLGRGGPPWTYQGHFTLRRHGNGWLVEWSPAVIVPGLGAGDRLAVLTTVPARRPLLDSSGKSLIPPSPTVEVGVR